MVWGVGVRLGLQQNSRNLSQLADGVPFGVKIYE